MSEVINNARTFKENFLQTPVFVSKGYSFNQKKLIEFIEKYYNSQFLTGDKDDDGFRFFYNIVKFPVRLAAKMVDLDTKDIRFVAEEGQSHVPVWCMNKELRAWMKDMHFGSVLNQISEETPQYGNYVLKVVGDEIKPVRLLNLINDPFVESLDESSVVIEEHYMTPDEIMKTKWDNKEEVLALFKKQPNESYVKVDEIYAYGKASDFGGKGDKFVRGRLIVAGFDDFDVDENTGKVSNDKLLILNKAIKKPPYFEFFWEKFQGRWLRMGVIEDLFEEQFRTNDAINLQAQGLHWTSKHLFQTRDMTSKTNLMHGVENGALIRVNSEITPIATEERNLAAFNAEIQNWDKNRREKTFTLETVSGETLPSATPFRLGFILQNAAGGYFDFKRENIALGIKRLLDEHIAPTFKKSKRSKHLFNFYGEDNEFASLEELYVEYELQNKLKKHIKAGGFISQEKVDTQRRNALEKIRSRSNREVEVPENYYENLRYRTDIVITSESIAVDAKIQTLTTILQTISTNPGILDDERTKSILSRIMDYAGVSPEDLRASKGTQSIPPQVLAGAGGSQRNSPPPGQIRPELQLSSTTKTF